MKKSLLLKCSNLLIVLLTIIFLQNLYGSANEIEQIKQAIAAKGANWTAGENWVTRLSHEERRQLCGSFCEPPDPSQANLLSIPLINNLPTALDWRDNNGNWVTPVRNQMSCGSCWDFAAVGQIESWWKVRYNKLDSMIDLSEQFILSCGDAGSCDGGWPHLALDFVAATGIPTEACFRYIANDQIPCSNACSNWEDEAIKIPGWGFITLEEDNVDIIKNALYRHPISACFDVYEDFMYYESGVYEHVWGELDAGHCIVIVGWNDEEESWICKNSWARNWGEDGYFRIKWHQCGMGAFIPFIWDEMTGPAIDVSPNHFNLNLTFGDSIVKDITITNLGSEVLEYSTMDYGGNIRFHTDRFMAWDDYSWWCGDPQLGGYGDHWLEYLETPVLDLSTTSAPYLTWMGNWAIENPASAQSPYDGWDGCNVWVSIDGGETFEVAAPTTPAYDCQSLWAFGEPEQGWNMGEGIAGWAGNSGGWIPVEFDLSLYKSDSVIIRFALASDLNTSAITDPLLYGFLIDEIVVSDGTTTIFEDHGDDAQTMKRIGLSEASANVAWLNIVNGGSTILPNESAQVGITFNTRNINPASYFGLIRFTSNDTTQPVTDVSFNMDVCSPEHDIGVEEVWLPGESLIIFSSCELGAVIRNCGLNDEADFDVICSVLAEEQTIYSDSTHVLSLSAGETDTVSFAPFSALQTGELHFVVSLSNLGDDYNDYNNRINSITEVTNLVDGFETETGYWTFEGGWGITDAHRAHTGNSTAHVNNGETPYLNNMNTTMTFTQGFDFNAIDKATLKFWSRYNIESDKDFCYVEVSTDNINWTKVDSLTGISPTWKQKEIGFTNFINAGYTDLWMRFRFVSDAENTGFGIFIDDVEIYYQNPTEIQTEEISTNIPVAWNLTQNFPNPFNMTTQIKYSLPEAGKVSITIYNVNGQVVRNLLHTYQTPGYHFINWDGCDNFGHQIGTGIYLYHLKVEGSFSKTKKMILMK